MLKVSKETEKTWYIDDCASTDEWLEKRKDGIGASAVGVLLGLDHYTTPMKLFAKMTGLFKEQPNEARDKAANRGHRMEVVIANDWAALGNIVCEESAHDFLCIDAKKPWRRISPDRFWWPAGTPKDKQTIENAFILECKTYQKRDERYKPVHLTPDNVFDQENFPYWYAQIQYQMGVCRIGKAVLGFIDMNDTNVETQFVEVDFNEGYFDYLMTVVDSFWNDHILTCVEPEEVKDFEDMKIKFPKSFPGSKMVATQEVERAVLDYKEAAAAEKAAKARKDAAKDIIGIAMGSAEALTDAEGKLLLKLINSKRNSLDTDRLKKERPELYEQYVTTSESRTLKMY